MSKPYFSSREFEFLGSLPLPFPEVGMLVHINCGAGEAFSQFHKLAPGLELEGCEAHLERREQFAASSDKSFSACVWAGDAHLERDDCEVLFYTRLSVPMPSAVVGFDALVKKYWPLIVEGGALILEVSLPVPFVDREIDWEAKRAPFLEKLMSALDLGKVVCSWFPDREKERGLFVMQKGGLK